MCDARLASAQAVTSPQRFSSKATLSDSQQCKIMSSSKQHPRPSPSRDVSNVTPGQPGGFIGEQGLISHGPSLVLKRLELSGYVEKLFTLDVTY